MQVTVLNSTFKTHRGDTKLSQIASEIQDGVYTRVIYECRVTLETLGVPAYKRKKKNLPAFTPSGRFGQCYTTINGEKVPCPPRKKALLEYNGNVVLDYDKLSDLEVFDMMEKVKNCPFSRLGFCSPSNKGYKIIVATSNRDPLQHASVYKAVAAYYDKLTEQASKGDSTSSNINRLCYVSADPLLHYNPDSPEFTEYQTVLFEEKQPKKEYKKLEQDDLKNQDELVIKALHKVEKAGLVYVEGKRRDFIKRLAIESVKYGVSENECWAFVYNSLLTSDCDENMVRKLVSAMYETVQPHEHGMYVKWTKENKKGKYKENKNNSEPKEYIPELYKERPQEDLNIQLPELTWDEIKEIGNDKLRDSIYSQQILESKLNEFFEFRTNTLKNIEEYRQKGWHKFKEVDKRAYNSIAIALRKSGVSCTSAKLENTISSDFSRKVHPIKEMFERWADELGNDKTDYIKQVASFVKTDAPIGLFESVFKKWLVASVANVYIEGQCTNHHCIILCSSQQGMNKTTFFTSLFSTEYVFAGHLDFKNKDSMILLADTFLVVLEEQFSVIDKEKDWETLKSIVTLPRVKTRWHYAKTSKLSPRIANFCGTANRMEILQDDTGNRRFIPFQLTDPININAFRKIDIRKMWAQAYRLYKEGFFYLPTASEKNKINKYQQGFKKLADEHYYIMDSYEPATDEKSADVEHLSSTEIREYLLTHFNINKDLSVSKVGRAMTFLGFKQKTFVRKKDFKRGRWWLIKKK